MLVSETDCGGGWRGQEQKNGTVLLCPPHRLWLPLKRELARRVTVTPTPRTEAERRARRAASLTTQEPSWQARRTVAFVVPVCISSDVLKTNVVWQELGWDSGEDFLKQQSSSVFELELGSTAEPRRSKRASGRSSSSIGIEVSLLGVGADGAASDAAAAAPEASAEGAWGGMSIERGPEPEPEPEFAVGAV